MSISISINYKSDQFSACLYFQKEYRLFADVKDTHDCKLLKDILKRYKVDVCIIPDDLNFRRYVFMQNDTTKFLVRKMTRLKDLKEDNFSACSSKCIKAIMSFNNHRGFTKCLKSDQIGFIGDCKLFRGVLKPDFRLKIESLESLKVFSKTFNALKTFGNVGFPDSQKPEFKTEK